MVNLSVERCPCPFRFERVLNVTVQGSSFSYFSQAVLDIYNCANIRIERCVFSHNRGTGIIQQPYRGNTGAVSICCKLEKSSTATSVIGKISSSMDVIVSNTTFLNNSAIASNTFRSTSSAFFNGILTGRAGGLGIFISTFGISHNITANVTNCTFKNNYATSFGGGMYFVFTGNCSRHRGNVTDTHFLSNTANLGGGGFITTVYSGGLPGTPHIVHFSNCMFSGNRGDAGGGMYLYILYKERNGSRLLLDNCTFTRNGGVNSSKEFGAALAASIYENFQEKMSLELQHNIHDCTFRDNSGSNAIVSLGHIPFVLSGTNHFSGNNGSALRMTGSQLNVYGYLEFINNTAGDGAALELLSFGQVAIGNQTQALFQGNQGRYGASIYVSAVEQTGILNGFNSQCFLLPDQNESNSPNHWATQLGINFTFIENGAWFGPAIYATSLMACSWMGLKYPYINETAFLDWPIFTFTKDVNTPYPVATNPIGIWAKQAKVHSWPGMNISLELTLRDELNHSAGSITRMALETSSLQPNFNVGLSLSPASFLVNKTSFMAITKLLVNHGSAVPDNFIGYVGNVSIQPDNAGILGVLVKDTKVPIYYEECLGGFELPVTNRYEESSCSCETHDPKVLQCEKDQDSVVIEYGLWATLAKKQKPNLFFYTCPPGYCQCFLNSSIGPRTCASVYTNSDPNRQCACGRTGVLCGMCPNGTGVSVLLNRCVTCSNKNLILVGALVLMDAVAIGIIVFFDIHIRQLLYPVLFFVQIACWCGFYFPTTSSVTWKYLYYFSSALSFYFPYDFCLYEDMSVVVSYSLRFIPLLTALVVCPMVATLRIQIRRTKWREHQFSILKCHGIWTVLLLTYTHTVATAVLVLVCPQVPDENGTFTSRWFVDGSVQCFQGAHAGLAAFSLAVLLLSVLLPVLFVLLTFKTSQIHSVHWLRNFGLAIQWSYSKQLFWWSGVELCRRLVFLIIATIPGIHTAIQAMALMVLIALYGYFQPYSQTVPNLVEVTFLVNFLIMLLIRSDPSIMETYSVLPTANITSLAEFTNCHLSQEVDYELITPLVMILTVLCCIPLILFALMLVATFLWLTARKCIDCVGRTVNAQRPMETIKENSERQQSEVSKSEVIINDGKED